MENNFINHATALLNSLDACTGNTAQLANNLSIALNKLEAVISQANAQFKAGDTHATFNKEFIRVLTENE